MNKTSDFIKLIDGVDQLQKYVQTNVINIPVPQEAKEMFEDINRRLDSDTKTFSELTKDKTSPEQMVEVMSGIHLNLLKTNKVIKETFEFVNMVAGDTPVKESFCSCSNRDCYDWDCFANNARKAADTVKATADATVAESKRLADIAVAESKRLADIALKKQREDFLALFGCELNLADLQGTSNCVTNRITNTVNTAVNEANRVADIAKNTAVNEANRVADIAKNTAVNASNMAKDSVINTVNVAKAKAENALDQAKVTVQLTPTSTCDISLKNPTGGIDCLKQVVETSVAAARTEATNVATNVFKKLTLDVGCPLDINNILTIGSNNALLKYAECTKTLAVNKANQVANEAKVLAERTANQVKDVAVSEANRLANVAAMAAKKVADDALSEANRLGEMAKQTASLVATEAAKGVFKGLGLNNASCRLDENNILSGGRNNSLVKYAECMAEVAKNTAVTETTKGLKTVFDNLNLNSVPCALDTNNIFTAGSGNALLKYTECRGNQAIDSLPKPTILGCELSIRNIPAAVSCIENSAKNAVMGPINTLASGFTTEMNNMLNKFKDLINIINGFGDTIWKFFQDIINTIKSQATLFIERINSEGGKILEKIKNESGKIVSYVTTEGDRIVKYILDQAGNIVKIITTQGNLILEKVKDQAGNIITFITTESGKIIKTVTDTGGQMVTYIKNKTGEFVKVATSTADKVISSVKDESGNIIKFVETSGGAIVKVVTDESGKIIRTVTDTGGKIVNTVSEKTVEFTTDASKFGKELLDIVLEQGKKAHETIGEVGQSISDSVSGIVDKIKEYTKIVSDIWEKIKEIGGMILKALWNGIVAVGRTIKWIIVNGPGWAMTYMKFWKKNLLIMRYNMPILIMMTVMIIGFVQTSSYLITGQTQAIPLTFLSLGAFGVSMIVANLFENIIRYLNRKIISNTIKQFVLTVATVIILKVIIVDFLLGVALPKFVQDNIILSSAIAIGIFLSSSGYLLYNNYNNKEEPIEPGIIDDIKGYFQSIIDTTIDV